jgi:hypothetical protein
MIERLREILRSKRQLRRELAGLPIAEKLRILDELRERSLAIARSRAAAGKRPTPGGESDRPADR